MDLFAENKGYKVGSAQLSANDREKHVRRTINAAKTITARRNTRPY